MRVTGLAATAAVFVLSAAAMAQPGPGPSPTPVPTPQPQPPELRGPDDRVTDFLRMRDEVSRRKPGPTDSRHPVPASPEDVAAGSQVRDSKGAIIGTIQSVNGGFAVVANDIGKVEVELESFAKNNKGLLINMPKSKFNAIVSAGKAGS